MTVSALALKLILILIPGGLATLILEKLTTYLKWESFKFVINSILLGGLSYLLSDLVFYIFCADDIKNFWLKFTSNDIPFWEIVRATGVSLIVGFGAAWIENKKMITRFARKFHIADKYGEENLYSYFLNSKEVTEVYVRDIANNLTFHGEVDSFSENEQISEITLRHVKVYKYDDSAFLYEIPKVFLSREKSSIFIEVPI
jgi:F0F1-type ATP synthase assembly protein I